MSFYKNYGSLASGAFADLRADALAIAEAGIRKAIPYEATRKLVSLSENELIVGPRRYPLSEVSHIYVVGSGKGSFPTAQALEEILGDRIEDGILIVKDGEKRTLPHIRTFESSHPIPDERSLEAARLMKEVLAKAGEGDLVFAPITGGSSALVNCPLDGITIGELQEVNRMLLACGAPINEINAVRKHICGVKGGRIVQLAQPAELITLTLDTCPPGLPWPDMCLPDPTTFQDAVGVLRLYGLWDAVPESVRRRLQKGLRGEAEETLKTLDGMKHSLYSVGDQRMCCGAAVEKARELGYEPLLLGTALDGEAKDMGIFLAGMAREILETGRPLARPCALISGGETTVTLCENPGDGGPNQETALGFAEKIPDGARAVCVSIDTDGTDGPCAIAGGIADGNTRSRAREQGFRLKDALKQHDAMNALGRLGDAIETGHTGTNVMNLRVVLVG